jgi:GNAT superfamily N-acetyltransferase
MVFNHVKDVDSKSANDFVNLCVPFDRRNEPSFAEGIDVKMQWVNHALKKFGCVGKLAYHGRKPIGMLQYLPNHDENIVEITCIFVPEKDYLRKGVGGALLRSLIEDVNERRSCFRDFIPQAIVAHAFSVPGRYPQNEFYQEMGFRKLSEDDSFLVYLPLQDDFVYVPKERRYIHQKEDKGIALIFFDGWCPFCISFNERIEKLIREVSPRIPIRVINKLEEHDEIEKRGVRVPNCVVNQQPIESSFFDAQSFKKEVWKALETTTP